MRVAVSTAWSCLDSLHLLGLLQPLGWLLLYATWVYGRAAMAGAVYFVHELCRVGSRRAQFRSAMRALGVPLRHSLAALFQGSRRCGMCTCALCR
jgi:hypothetical protein